MSIKTLSKKIALSLQAMVMAFGVGAAGVVAVAVTPSSALALTCTPTTLTIDSGASCGAANGAKENLFGAGGIFQVAANTLIFLVGAIAVLFLIVGGLRYAVSGGDPKAVESAKNTITYAIVGIVVAILSFAAVQFVIGALNNSAS